MPSSLFLVTQTKSSGNDVSIERTKELSKNQRSYVNFRRVFARAAKNGLPRFDVRVSMNVWVSSQNMAGLTHGSFFMGWATRNGLSETCFLPRICSHFCKFWQRFSQFSGSACTTAFVFDEGIGGHLPFPWLSRPVFAPGAQFPWLRPFLRLIRTEFGVLLDLQRALVST